MAILIGEHKISTVVTSSVMGHSGGGMFPLTLFPSYRRFTELVKKQQITNLTKSSTRFKRVGNLIWFLPWTWKFVKRIEDGGLVNAYALTNSGVDYNAKIIDRSIDRGFQIIPNFYPEFIKGAEMATRETIEAIRIYKHHLQDNFWAIELNYSCPNSDEAIEKNIYDAIYCTRKIRQEFPDLIIIVKISYVHPHEFAREQIVVGADIIHSVNTIPFNLIFSRPGMHSPLDRVGGGGVSGKPAFKKAYTYNRELRKKINAPMIMGCGIANIEDAKKYLDIGAEAISICTIVRLNTKQAEKIITLFN